MLFQSIMLNLNISNIILDWTQNIDFQIYFVYGNVKLADLLTRQTKLMLRVDTLNHKNIFYDKLYIFESISALQLGFAGLILYLCHYSWVNRLKALHASQSVLIALLMILGYGLQPLLQFLCYFYSLFLFLRHIVEGCYQIVYPFLIWTNDLL